MAVATRATVCHSEFTLRTLRLAHNGRNGLLCGGSSRLDARRSRSKRMADVSEWWCHLGSAPKQHNATCEASTPPRWLSGSPREHIKLAGSTTGGWRAGGGAQQRSSGRRTSDRAAAARKRGQQPRRRYACIHPHTHTHTPTPACTTTTHTHTHTRRGSGAQHLRSVRSCRCVAVTLRVANADYTG